MTSAVSIIIVNHNGAEVLRDCLDSLMRVPSRQFEVIVVDNASVDNSRLLLRSYPWVKLIKSERNLGFAGGNNLGLKHCTGEFILLLNSDTIVTSAFLEPLVDYLEKHHEVGIVQPKMLLGRDSYKLDVCGAYLTRFGALYNRGFYQNDSPGLFTKPVFTIKGACMMFRRSLIEEVGGYLFNEDFFCYYEETDFCHRAWLAGYSVYFVPDSVIRHLQGYTSDRTQPAGFALRQFLTNQIFSLLSNLSAPSLWRIMPMYFLMFLGCMIAAAITGKKTVLLACCRALISLFQNTGKICAQRKIVQNIRKISDRELFDQVMRNPRADYYWKTFTGRVGEYQELPHRTRAALPDLFAKFKYRLDLGAAHLMPFITMPLLIITAAPQLAEFTGFPKRIVIGGSIIGGLAGLFFYGCLLVWTGFAKQYQAEVNHQNDLLKEIGARTGGSK